MSTKNKIERGHIQPGDHFRSGSVGYDCGNLFHSHPWTACSREGCISHNLSCVGTLSFSSMKYYYFFRCVSYGNTVKFSWGINSLRDGDVWFIFWSQVLSLWLRLALAPGSQVLGFQAYASTPIWSWPLPPIFIDGILHCADISCIYQCFEVI